MYRVKTRITFIVCALLSLITLMGCGHGGIKSKEVAYVAAGQVNLRDQLANVYNKTGTVNNGERVEILETRKRFARIRNARGEEGWIEQRHLVNSEIFAACEKLAHENAAASAQAHGVARADLNIHLEPDREADHLYQLKEGDRVEVIRRAVAEKPQSRIAAATKGNQPQKALDDWWLVRDGQKHTGWVLARMVDIDAPFEVAQYAEGQRIVAYFVLNHVQDGDKRMAQYLVLLTEPKDGLPFDFNQARIFTWNTKRHRYETAYRERKIAGMLPATVGHEEFPSEGDLPTFTLRVQDDTGQIAERKYRLSGPIVRRVLSSGEQAGKDTHKDSSASRKRPGT